MPCHKKRLFRLLASVKHGEAAPKGATKRSPERSEDWRLQEMLDRRHQTGYFRLWQDMIASRCIGLWGGAADQ